MDRVAAEEFARCWIEDWNCRDVDAIVRRFRPDAQFTSPRAAFSIGTPLVLGRDAIRAYWQSTLERVQSLHFTLDRVLWDADSLALAILYSSSINGATNRACEIFHFDAEGQVTEGEALFGAAV